MSPSVTPPTPKAAQPQRTSSQESTTDGIRKRVCKACDRCRLKKSKCDGSHPCSRCKADNAICVFGERKKSHDKIYPKGYVEMLEQQQSQLVSGLREMYKRLRTGKQWDGQGLPELNGHPLTHDILAALNLLETKHDGSNDVEAFEEDVQKLQSRLLAEGAGYAHRRGSMSSESDHSQGQSASNDTPVLSRPQVFNDNFNFSPSASPHPQSPTTLQRPSIPQSHHSQVQQRSPLTNDPQLYQAEWAYPDASTVETLIRSRFAMSPSKLEPDMSLAGGMSEMDQQWDASTMSYGMGVGNLPSFSPQQVMEAFGSMTRSQDAGTDMDLMDIDLNQFIQVGTGA